MPTQEILSDWKVLGTSEGSLGEAAELVSAGAAPEGDDCLCSTQVFGDLDFHVDVRFGPQTTCRIGLLTSLTADSREGSLLTVCFPESGTGGVAQIGGRDLGVIGAEAQRTLDPEGWNDLRLRIVRGRLTLRINGWTAIDLPDVLPEDGTYRIALYAPTGESTTLWRYVRLRELK